MPIIALVGNKGGAGKTTLCVNLASALHARGSTLVLDADPQQSSRRWHDLADAEDTVLVIEAVNKLSDTARKAQQDHEFIVLDCPPSVAAKQTREALACADIALVPVQPSPFDLWATIHIEDEVKRARKTNPGLRAFLVINQLEPRTRLSRIIRMALAELGLPAADTSIKRRMIYRSAVLAGRSVRDMGRRGEAAAHEIEQLIEEVIAP